MSHFNNILSQGWTGPVPFQIFGPRPFGPSENWSRPVPLRPVPPSTADSHRKVKTER